MKNHLQPGNTITVPRPDDVQGGEIVTMGELVGVAAATGADLDLVLVGVFDLPKVGTDAITIGQAVYLAGGVVTTDDDSGANRPCAILSGRSFAAGKRCDGIG